MLSSYILHSAQAVSYRVIKVRPFVVQICTASLVALLYSVLMQSR